MGNFSKPPLDTLLSNLDKGYVGLRLEQGVPLLDRDFTLLNDLIAATVQRVVARYIGDGVAAGSDGFEILQDPAENDFGIDAGVAGSPGSCLVGGLEVTIESRMLYSDQADVPPLTTPDATQPDPRLDLVYLDAWLTEVEGDEDSDLLNGDDVGLQTSVRVKPAWRVRVAEGVPVPGPEPGHVHTELARLSRAQNDPLIQDIADLRQTRLNLAAVERRLTLLEDISLIPTFVASPNQFSPKLGEPGTPVTLFGNNFNVGNPQVLFGAVAAAVVGTPSATEIETTIPTMPEGPVAVTVTTDGGSVTSDDQFVVLPGAPAGDPPEFDPAPNEFSPKIGTANTPVTLFGQNFDAAGLVVEFDGEAATVDTVTATQIVARVPSGLSGQVAVAVTTDFGAVRADDAFTAL